MQKIMALIFLWCMLFSTVPHYQSDESFSLATTTSHSSLEVELSELSNEAALQLAHTYAPVLWFYKDSLWEEPFPLIEAEYFVQISQITSDCYKLERNGYAGAKHLQSQYQGVKNPVYVRITTDNHKGATYLVIQYWFHYLYNYGSTLSLFNVNHEGEWEMVEVILEYTPFVVRGTSSPPPNIVAYSRHSSGETHMWNDESVEKGGSSGYHPVAYIAYGTHAPYFKDLGWNEDLNQGIGVTPDDMYFILLKDQEWLDFSGKWGGQQNSPFGPKFQEEKWSSPVGWAMNFVNSLQVHLGDEGHLLITNKKGQRIGFVGEQFVNEIQGAYAVVDQKDEYYYLPENDYSVDIDTDKDRVDFDALLIKNGVTKQISYQNELVSHITETFSKVKEDMKEYTSTMDNRDIALFFDTFIHMLQEELEIVAFLCLAVIVAFVTFKVRKKIFH